MKYGITALVGVAGLATAALGQAGWNISVSNNITGPGQNSTVVKVSARFSPSDHAFGAALFDVVAGETGWSNNELILVATGTNPGVIDGARVNAVTAGQIHFPPLVFANTENPIDVWRATWSTNDFSPRQVQLRTETRRFDVYISATTPQSESRLAGLLEGSGQITIIPAPSALALLGMGGLIAARRRR